MVRFYALPPFVNRMDLMPKFKSIILSQTGFKAKHIFGNYVEFHFVIGFYYIARLCGGIMGGATTFACKSQGCLWAGLVYFIY